MKLFNIIALTLIPLSSYSIDFNLPIGGNNSIIADIDISECFGAINLPDVNNLCSAIDSFDLSYSGSFSIGGCSVGYASSTECFTKSLKAKCSSLVNKRVTTPMSAAISSSLDFNFLKGEAFKKKKCGERETPVNITYPSGKTEEYIIKKTPINTVGASVGIFSSRVDDIRDCMKVSGDRCLDPSFQTLPETSIDTEKAVMEAAQQIAAADSTIAGNMASLQVEISKKIKSCKSDQDCISKVMNNEASPEALIKKENAKIELASSMELTIMRKATRGDTYYVYKDKKSIDSLPVEVQVDYSDGVTRQNAADALIHALYKEIVDIKKEGVNASYGGVSILSSAYQASDSIHSLQENLNGLEEQEKEKEKSK